MENWYPAVREYITAHREEIVSELMALCHIPSISQPGKDGLPFGKDVDDVLTACAALYRRHGIPMDVRHEAGYAIAVCEGEGDGIGLFGHADVVPVNDDWTKTAPFAPIEENGILYGRGVNDNKAGIIASLYAILALQAAGAAPKSRLTLFAGGNEEAGMIDIMNFAANETMPAVSLVPDSGFPVGLGEKGILRLDCRSKTPLRDVKKLDGGSAYNVILDDVTVETAFAPAFSVKGLTAHAAHPAGSVNAAKLAAEKLCAMPICDGDKDLLAGLQTVLTDDYGSALGIASTGAFDRLTCVNGITRVGEDGRLLFTLDIRFGNEITADEILSRMNPALEALGFTAEVHSASNGYLMDESGEDLQLILRACRDASGQAEAAPFKMFGGTYARRLKNAYPLSHSAPWDKAELHLAPGRGGAHQSDECLSVDALLEGICTLALIVGRLDARLTAN